MFATKGGITSSPFTGVLAHLTGAAGPSGFGASSTAEQVAANWDGTGKVVLITGANTGLGQECARVLASKGAEVIIAARDTQKAQAAADKIRTQHSGAQVGVIPLDLSSLESVKKCADEYKAGGKPLHVLMLNAGVMACPFMKTKDGHEMQFGTNHLGHFALTHYLQDTLLGTAKKTGQPGRVVVLSSTAHFGPYKPEPLKGEDEIDKEEGYTPWGAYGQSKLCNVLFARELQRRFQEQSLPLAALVCHPGVIPTSDLFRHNTIPWPIHQGLMLALKPFFKSIPQGAATQTYLATSDAVLQLGGDYFADCNINPSSPASHDKALAARLWAMSDRMCGFA